MDYQIVQADGRKELEAAVRELIRAGWQPLGGFASRPAPRQRRTARSTMRA